MAKSNEPIWWSMFSAGGVMSAFFVPALIVITAIAVPAGWISAEGLRELVQHPITRIFLFVVIALSLFHWAHRFKFAMEDLGLKQLGRFLDIFCYGSAIVITIIAAAKLVTL
jgi:fumarate reductase subunit D